MRTVREVMKGKRNCNQLKETMETKGQAVKLMSREGSKKEMRAQCRKSDPEWPGEEGPEAGTMHHPNLSQNMKQSDAK